MQDAAQYDTVTLQSVLDLAVEANKVGSLEGLKVGDYNVARLGLVGSGSTGTTKDGKCNAVIFVEKDGKKYGIVVPDYMVVDSFDGADAVVNVVPFEYPLD